MSIWSILYHVWGTRATRELRWYRRASKDAYQGIPRLPAAWFCRIIIVTDIAIGLYTTVKVPLANDSRMTLAFPTSLSDERDALDYADQLQIIIRRILWNRDGFR